MAHVTAPVHDNDTKDPAFYVMGSSYQWDQGATGPQSDNLETAANGLGVTNVATWQDSASRLSGKTTPSSRGRATCAPHVHPPSGTAACTGTSAESA